MYTVIEMNDEMLKRIALVGAIVGLLLTALISGNNTQATLISTIDAVPEGKEIKLTGFVESVSDLGKVMYITIGEQKIEKTNAVLFKSGDVQLIEGQIVTITGTVDSYNGEIQVIGNRIELKK